MRGGVLIFKFCNFTLDAERRELRSGSQLVAIEPQVFDVLEFLITHRERVVTSDDLIAAIWHGRVVSEATVATRMNAVRRAVNDSGDLQQLIRTVPRRGYRFVGEVQEIGEQERARKSEPHIATTGTESSHAHLTKAPPLPDRPSIAVLPFANLSGDPEQEYFADGITEDLTMALAQFRWLFVIARNSSFAFRNQAVDAKHIARELGVRYLLEGSVRKGGSKIRISGQLIDAATGAHLWADRFDGALQDIFAVQDEVTASVVGAIGPKLERAEIERAKRKPTESLDAYDCFLRGMASVHQGTRESSVEALRLFRKATDLDPDFASAYGMAAWCYAWRKWDSFMSDRVQETADAEFLARRATELGKDDAVALAAGGYALAFVVHDVEDGAAFVNRALALNPNFATAWHSSGWVNVLLGEHEEAINRFERGMRLSPFDSLIFRAQGGTAQAHLLSGRFNEASLWADKALRERRGYRPAIRVAAASNALAGRMTEAQTAMAYLREIDPDLRLSNLRQLIPLRRAQDLALFADGLRRAGLPE